MNAKVYCDGTRIRCLHEIKLTVSMSGAPVEFDFSSEWDGLGKTAVFTCDGTKDVILDAEGKAVVPHEILTTPGMDVVVGVYAVREDGTTWPAPTPLCRIGRVETGADPSGDESYPPTPDVGEQAVAAASKALEAAEEAQEVAADIQRRADAGEFDGKDGYTPVKGVDYFDGKDGATGATGSPGEDGEDGGYYTPAVTQPDDTTMRVNFTPSKSGMPTVLQQDIKLPKGSSVELDPTLTQSGKAADAKAVGDALAVLEEKIPESGGGITEETDPTVPAWAKAPEKPSYTAEEVGALPVGTEIPAIDPTLTQSGKAADAKAVGDALAKKQAAGNYLTEIPNDYAKKTDIPSVPTKVSAFENDKGYLTEQDLRGYAKRKDIPTKPSDIGAQPAGNYATKDAIPTTLPNPHKLTFSGAVNAEYDGSEAVEVVIPQGYTKAEIDAIMGSYITDIDNLVGGDA